VGWEGLIGSIVMLGGALPLLQHLPYRDGSGFAEDTVGSLCMIRNSRAISGVLPGAGLLGLGLPGWLSICSVLNWLAATGLICRLVRLSHPNVSLCSVVCRNSVTC
jgi:hypothetical protein